MDPAGVANLPYCYTGSVSTEKPTNETYCCCAQTCAIAINLSYTMRSEIVLMDTVMPGV